MLVKACLFATGCFVATVTLADFTTADYAQDGLIAHFDAINNANTGTHDPAATTWTDLKGGTPWVLMSSGSWSADKAFACDGAGCAATNTTTYFNLTTADLSFQRTYKAADKSTAVMFKAGNNTGAFGCYYGWHTNEMADFMLVNHAKGVIVNTNEPTTVTTIYNLEGTQYSKSVKALYRDAIPSLRGGSWNFNYSLATLGAVTAAGLYPFKGEIYAIRLYSRELTDAEIVLNNGLDRVRFQNADPATAFAAKDGYSYSNGAFRVRQTLYTGGGGTVQVKNIGSAATQVTYDAVYKSTVTFVATPATGYKFSRWIGGGLSGDAAYEAETSAAADAVTTFEAVFERVDGEAWWSADTLTWMGDHTLPIVWNADPCNWWATTASAHRFPADGDLLVFERSRQSHVVFGSGVNLTNIQGLQLKGAPAHTTNTVEIQTGASIATTGAINQYKAIQIGWGAGISMLHVNGGEVISPGVNVGVASGGYGELLVDKGGLFTCNSTMAVPQSPSLGTGVVTVANGTISVAGWFSTASQSYAGATATKENVAKTRSEIHVGEKGVLNLQGLAMRGHSLLEITGGELSIEHSASDWTGTSPFTQWDTGPGSVHRITMTGGMIRTPKTPSASNSYARERLSRFDICGLGDFLFSQEGGIVTNCGIWFAMADQAMCPPRYEISGGTLYMRSWENLGDKNHGYPDGIAMNGLGVFTNCNLSGTFSVKGGTANVHIPRILTVIGVNGNCNNATTGRVYVENPLRPHIEMVLTKTGVSTMELYATNTVLGMYTFIPEGGLQLTTTNRFAIWHQTDGEALTVPEEPYYRAPNDALWETGVFADRADEWGVTLKDTAQVASGINLGAGVVTGWLALPNTGSNSYVRARILFKMLAGAKTLEEVAAAMTSAGYPAMVTTKDGEYNVAIDVLGLIGDRLAGRRFIFDFNAVQDAIAVRDRTLMPNATVLKAKLDFLSRGFSVMVR